ncbi:MAG TPA: TIGR02186 family protein [Hyphomicrobiaceae bacterium]|nr:TIGR02186 family protein [Hyphomicrobiaceae bacterium]
MIPARPRTAAWSAGQASGAVAAACAALFYSTMAIAQAPPASPVPPNAAATPAATSPPRLGERVQADVSTRSVSITSSFTGTEILVFGSIDNAKPTRSEEDQYEVIITLSGAPQRLVSRRKNNVGGIIWINTQSITFSEVPSYYAIASTRPIDEIADAIVLRQRDIGFDQIRMTAESGWASGLTTADLRAFKAAVIRLKKKERLYKHDEFGVRFVGRNLFRATIDLPANVPVGPLATRVYLFRQGRLIDTFESRVQLAREGLERYLYNFAFGYPMLYGIAAVLLAAGAGLAASSLFRRVRA